MFSLGSDCCPVTNYFSFWSRTCGRGIYPVSFLKGRDYDPANEAFLCRPYSHKGPQACMVTPVMFASAATSAPTHLLQSTHLHGVHADRFFFLSFFSFFQIN